MRPTHFLPALLCTSLVSAWSWPENAADVKALLHAHQEKRAVTLGNPDAAAPNPTDVINTSIQTTASSAAATTAASSAAATSDASSTGTAKSSGGKTTSGGKTSKSSTSTFVSIPDNAGVGGASMITPNPTSASQYYKVGDFVTFAWNYTSLSVTPTALDIMASCSANKALYTLALNQSISATTGALTWDTGNYQATATQQLPMGKYTLILYDAAKSMSATATPGYFGTYSQFTFGMYLPQPYTPLADYVCATCSGGISDMERQTLGFLAVMASITILTFTGYLGGAGLLF